MDVPIDEEVPSVADGGATEESCIHGGLMYG